MAFTKLTPQITTRAGIVPSYLTLHAAGDSFDNTFHNIIIHFKNTGAEKTITIGPAKTIDGRTLPALTVVVPATTGSKYVGPFPELYDAIDSDNSLPIAIKITYSPDVTNLTAALFTIGPTSY